jgi:hypothetical protein
VWALGGAELAAFRGDELVARELWMLCMRVGANVGTLFPFQPGEHGRLATLLGDEEQRDELLTTAPVRNTAAITSRIGR